MRTSIADERPVAVPFRGGHLLASLAVPRDARGVALLAGDAGCGRQSPERRLLAGSLRQAGFATLLVDLLTPAELADPASAAALRLDVQELEARLRAARAFIALRPDLAALPLALLGCGGAGAAALSEAAFAPRGIVAVVSDCRWPDRLGALLHRVGAPVLLIAEEADLPALARAGRAGTLLRSEHALVTVPGPRTGRLPEDRAKAVARDASLWLSRHVAPPGGRRRGQANVPDRAHRRGAG